jgi:hypothetical protein
VTDTNYINRIESEISDIKTMLNDYGVRNANRKDKFTELLNDDELADENIASNYGSQQDFIRQQKKEIVELKDRLEKEKHQYQSDKGQLEEIRLSDPALYRKKSEILSKVKEGLDRRITQLNQRMSKVKELEVKF